MEKIPCTVEILTLNNEKTIEKALESVKDFAEILLIDGNSSDHTLEIAKKFGARIIPQQDITEKNIRISDYSAVRNKGLQQATYPWFLFIDSDEYLSPEAVEEIRTIIAHIPPRPRVYRLPRKFVVDGNIIERASVYPNYQIRLFHRDCVTQFIKSIHETIEVKPECVIHKLRSPEYVPMPALPVIRKKWSHYLDMQQEALKDLTTKRWLQGLKANTKKFCAYTVKYVLTFVRGSGKRMPFWYEFYNATYHLRLMGRITINCFRKIFKK